MRVPADWEPQSAIWLSWPHNRETWPGRFEPVPDVFRQWIHTLADVIDVRVLADPETIDRESRRIGNGVPVQWVPIATNDCWIRDYGPTFLVDDARRSVHAVAWRYNAWGGKYPPWNEDAVVAPQIAQHLRLPFCRSSLCVEGGAMEWDGNGRLLTTSDCLVTNTRNPGWSRRQVEAHLKSVLGLHEIAWIDGGGLEGDDTDGHIDQLARFVDSENVVAATCDPSDTANADALAENFRRLQCWGQQTSPQVTIHPLPIPPPRYIDGQRVPESYCNFLRLGPDHVLVPTFRNPATDDRALGVIRDLCRHRHPAADVIPVDCSDLVWGLGALHCASLNQPAVPENA